MLAQASCTLYKYNGIGFDRHYISSCHWQENRASNVLKSGLESADSVTVYIQNESLTVVPETASFDMLVKGECDFEFDNTNPQTVSESMKEFRKQYPHFVTVSSIDNKLYGLKELQHIKISAR